MKWPLLLTILVPPLMLSPGGGMAAPPIYAPLNQSPQLHRVRVLGKDERQPVPERLKELSRGVGLVYDKAQKGFCTAFCVAADMIASNAHCLIRQPKRSKDVDLSAITFILKDSDRTVGSRLRYVDQKQPLLSVYAGYYRGGRTASNYSKDWAFARLQRSICLGRELEFASIDRAKAVSAARYDSPFLIGYHRDKGIKTRWVSSNCYLYSTRDLRALHPTHRRLVRANHNLIVHECDTENGASGSPILINTPDGARVLAINAGHITNWRYRINRRTKRRRTTYRHTANIAVHANAFLAGLERFRAETLISDLDELRELQALLARARLYNASVDGIYGAGTRSAILRHERHHNLAPLGMPTAQLLANLRKHHPAPQVSQPIEVAKPAVKGVSPVPGLIISGGNSPPSDTSAAQTQPAPVTDDKQRMASPTSPKRASLRAHLPPGATFKDCDVCPEMIVVPAGSFTMGSPANEPQREQDEAQIQVSLAKPLAVGKFEVTFEEWEACVDEGGCKQKPDDRGWGRLGRPVIDVSWSDITKQYLPWLSRKTGKTYRLLTEAEWEYVARAGTASRYSWGDKIGKGISVCDGCGSQWDNKKTAPVGSFKPNAFGIHDMHGNVWEWVQDTYEDSYQTAPTDGSARTTGRCDQRVLRGGAWNSTPRLLRSAYREWDNPGSRSRHIGFRVALGIGKNDDEAISPNNKRQRCEKTVVAKPSFDELMKKAGLLDKRKPRPQAQRPPRLSANDKSKLVKTIRNCIEKNWRIVHRIDRRRRIPIVALGWKLDRNGKVIGDPIVINGGSGRNAKQAVANAIRAVKRCRFNLPPNLYKYWATIDRWEFRP